MLSMWLLCLPFKIGLANSQLHVVQFVNGKLLVNLSNNLYILLATHLSHKSHNVIHHFLYVYSSYSAAGHDRVHAY